MRVREIEREGLIGSLSFRSWCFSGFSHKFSCLEKMRGMRSYEALVENEEEGEAMRIRL